MVIGKLSKPCTIKYSRIQGASERLRHTPFRGLIIQTMLTISADTVFPNYIAEIIVEADGG